MKLVTFTGTKVGFTGSRLGMTRKQKSRVRDLLVEFQARGAKEFHHGDCKGADAIAWWIAAHLGYWTIAHPGMDQTMRAFTNSDEVRLAKPPLDRNHDIVNVSDVLIATPSTAKEVLRSGTWATIRYARKANRQLELILPRP